MTSALAPASALLQVLAGGLLVLGLQRSLAPGPEAVSGELLRHVTRGDHILQSTWSWATAATWPCWGAVWACRGRGGAGRRCGCWCWSTLTRTTQVHVRRHVCVTCPVCCRQQTRHPGLLGRHQPRLGTWRTAESHLRHGPRSGGHQRGQ